MDDEGSRRSQRERTADALAALALYRKGQSLGVSLRDAIEEGRD